MARGLIPGKFYPLTDMREIRRCFVSDHETASRWDGTSCLLGGMSWLF